MSDPGSGDPGWPQHPYGQPPQPYGAPPGSSYPVYPPQAYPPQTYPPQTYPPQTYPPPGYGPPGYPPGYAPPGFGPPPPNGGRGRKGLIIAAGVVVGAIVIAVALLLFVGKSAKSDATPTDAAKTLLSAAKTGNATTITNALCAQDRTLARAVGINPFVSGDRVTDYQVGDVAQTDPTHASVAVSVTTASNPAPRSEQLPVIRQGNGWKVCYSSAISSAGGVAGLPTGIPSGLLSSLANELPTSLPSGLLSEVPTSISGLCAQQSSGIVVASVYVGLAESGEVSAAQACVYKDTVATATTQRLSGRTLLPTGVDTSDGSITLTGTDGSTVVVKTTKEPDGKYYVSGVTLG